MLLVSIESPFKPSDDEVAKYEGRYTRAELLRQNLVYARLALLNSLKRGEAPFASHLIYTQVWAESDELRKQGIAAGIEYHHRTDLVALCVDLGTSGGMKLAREHAQLINVPHETRMILDSRHGKDPREALAAMPLDPVFPYLEELLASERASGGRIKIGNGVA